MKGTLLYQYIPIKVVGRKLEGIELSIMNKILIYINGKIICYVSQEFFKEDRRQQNDINNYEV